MRANPRSLLLVAAVALLPACDRVLDEAVTAVATPPLDAPTLVAPSAEAVVAFRTAFEGAAQAGDADALGALFDWRTLAMRALQGLPVPESMLQGFEVGAAEAARRSGVVASFAPVGEGTASLRYLGTESRDGHTWHTWRFLHDEGGFDHISLLLATDEAGVVRVVDTHQLTTGEPMAQVVRRMVLPAVARDAGSVVERVSGRTGAYFKQLEKIKAAQLVSVAGRPAEALAVLDTLSPELATERWVLIQKVHFAGMVSDEAYAAAIEDLRTHHPGHPTTGLHLIDGYTMAGRHDDALAAVDTVQAGALPDAHFDVVRSSLQLLAGRHSEAEASAVRAIVAEPTLMMAHWGLVSVRLATGDHTGVTDALLGLHGQFGVEFDFTGIPEFDAYVGTPEHLRLLESMRGGP